MRSFVAWVSVAAIGVGVCPAVRPADAPLFASEAIAGPEILEFTHGGIIAANHLNIYGMDGFLLNPVVWLVTGRWLTFVVAAEFKDPFMAWLTARPCRCFSGSVLKRLGARRLVQRPTSIWT